ncbi:MAG TPA: extracellular solute-binding protein [Planctomycetota bacterium]|nr:extracellular solute-binding protein [Planctomycetota bacterium]
MMRQSGRLLLALVLMALAGCGDTAKPLNVSPPNGTGAKQTLSIVWAQWTPADVLREMAEEWGKANNTEIKMSLFPWSIYQKEMWQEFSSGGTKYDIVIGDSQWIGKCATEGHYLDLSDWLTKEVPNIEEIESAALKAYCEYPLGSGRFFAAPCEIDGCGFAYRKDLFEDPKEREAYKAKYNRELDVPKTWSELKDIAEFFHRPDKSMYGAALFTDSGQYDAITMGFMQVMWSWGGKFCDPNFNVEGVLNSKEGVEALQFYTDLAKFTPPNGGAFYHDQCHAAFTEGKVAMTMSFFALMPPLLNEKQSKFAKSTGFFAVPAGPKGRYISLGGQGISVMRKSPPEKQELAKNFIRWFLETSNQKRWGAKPGCFSANRKANEDPVVRNAAPFNAAYMESLEFLRDFYNTPEFGELLASCQNHWNAAVTGKVSAKEAMDALAKEHTDILKKSGALK